MNPSPLKPSPRHDHVYAVVRYDQDCEDAPMDLRVRVVKVVADPQFADREVARLNELNGEKGCYYFASVTRIEKESVIAVPVQASPTPSKLVPELRIGELADRGTAAG